MKCRNCKGFTPYCYTDMVHLGATRDWCIAVSDSPDPDLERDCKYYRAMTNADRIRSMTDEELAEYFAKITECGECEACLPNDICMATDELCKGALLNWLKQECSDEST